MPSSPATSDRDTLFQRHDELRAVLLVADKRTRQLNLAAKATRVLEPLRKKNTRGRRFARTRSERSDAWP
jgi:hypothetical protein